MKKWLSFGAKAGVSVAILAGVLARTDVPRIAALLASVGGGTVVVVFALMLVQTVLTAYRWVLVSEAVRLTLDVWPALQAILVSLLLNQCLPSFVGADAYRMYWLYRESNQLGPAVRSVLIDRVLGMVALIVLFAAGIVFLLRRLHDSTAESGLVLLLAGGLAGTIAFFTSDLIPRAWQRVRVIRELATVSGAARALMLSRTKGPAVAVVGILVHVITALVMFGFARDLALPLTLLDCLLFTPPIMLLAAVPISIAGWGVREGVMVGALSMVGIGTESALALSILVGFTMLANGLLGVFPLLFGGQRYVAARPQLETVRGET